MIWHESINLFIKLLADKIVTTEKSMRNIKTLNNGKKNEYDCD